MPFNHWCCTRASYTMSAKVAAAHAVLCALCFVCCAAAHAALCPITCPVQACLVARITTLALSCPADPAVDIPIIDVHYLGLKTDLDTAALFGPKGFGLEVVTPQQLPWGSGAVRVRQCSCGPAAVRLVGRAHVGRATASASSRWVVNCPHL